jgi:hypothetical protein
MMSVLDRDMLKDALVVWRGRSGRSYALRPLALESFLLAPDRLYLVAIGSHVLWTGTGDDLVSDPESRARFRLAMDCADRAFEVDGADSPDARLTVLWDLENAERTPGRDAA